MRTRLLLAAVCLLALPMWFSPSKGDKLTNSAPFATVALAGHTVLGGWCECGAPGCICDPGEEMGGHSARPVSDASSAQRNHRAKPGRVSELDFGSGAILIALALFVWSRMRA